MTMTEAVEAARREEEQGFQYLYESTYSYNFYLAGKYLKDDPDAINDVLQESYIKAFNSLFSLKDPEKFPKWFSMIVTRTSLNELRKKKENLFSQMQDEDGELDFSDNFESDRTDIQPEVSIEAAETKRLLKEILDTLTDEQRLCIIMYYFEEIPVKKIAEDLSVSENTVKSRLNYGRKHIKEKVEELEKNGTKLYGILPLPFFLFLLKSDCKNTNVKAGSVKKTLIRRKMERKYGGKLKKREALAVPDVGVIIGSIVVTVAIGVGLVYTTAQSHKNGDTVQSMETAIQEDVKDTLEDDSKEIESAVEDVAADVEGQESSEMVDSALATDPTPEPPIKDKVTPISSSGTIAFVKNNGDGTFLCKSGSEERTYAFKDDATIYMVSFSENADDEFMIQIPASAFNEIEFDKPFTYQGSELYDTTSGFTGNAYINGGFIIEFKQDFRD